LSAPAIHQADEARGLLVIEDFGDDTVARLLKAGAAPEPLYAAAVDALIALHKAPGAVRIDVPRYDEGQLVDKAMLLLDWFLPAMGATPTPAARADYQAAWAAVLPLRQRVPESLALRDYFPENLMWLPGRAGAARMGLLDFQDAMLAPAVYDLVSLVEDARRDVPDTLRHAMLERYRAAFPGQDRAAFDAAAAVMAAQRHARVIGVFTRLWKRDGKPIYLAHIPRVWRLMEQALGHPGLAPLRRWFDTHVPAKFRRAPEAA
jgi:aminoglycoside/choline kinase family phosphotransferase